MADTYKLLQAYCRAVRFGESSSIEVCRRVRNLREDTQVMNIELCCMGNVRAVPSTAIASKGAAIIGMNSKKRHTAQNIRGVTIHVL